MAINNSIDEFKSNFHGGTRRNRFEIVGEVGEGANLSTFHARAFTLPAVGIGEIPVDYRGRRLYIPGDRDYPQWTLEILDDSGGEGSKIYHAFQDWQNRINNHTENTSETGPAADRKLWTLKHMDFSGQKILKTFQLKGCWPVSVGAIQLAMGARDELVTFDVTVRYDYLNYIEGEKVGNPVG